MSGAVDGWRDRVLREFCPAGARLTVAVDADGLILDEAISSELRRRGFETLVFEDPVSFRYAFESRYRSYWDDDKPVHLVVVSRQDSHRGVSLPFDLTQSVVPLRLGLDELFPTLSRTVVATLNSSDLDALYDAVEQSPPAGVLGDAKTKDFVLRHVFRMVPEFVVTPPDLLRVLFHLHHGGRTVPPGLGKHFVRALRRKNRFLDWPLGRIVSDRDAFFGFLQERWPLYLDKVSRAPGTPEASHDLAYRGPAELPFDHNNVRVYIDNLFLEGILRPVVREDADTFAGSWIAAGVQSKGDASNAERLERLVDAATKHVPARDARYDDWLRFARRWAEAGALATAVEIGVGSTASEDEPAQTTKSRLATLWTRVDETFAEWIKKRYAGLANLPPVPPVMLHHVPSLLFRHVDESPNHKAALLVVDGLSMDQWVAVREELFRRSPDYRFRESAVFAWIPTLTSVSRQATFAGVTPFCFPANSIHSTNREPALWRNFWADRGLPSNAVVYQKKLGQGSLDAVEDLISRPGVRVAGLIADTVDKIMHGMELGSAGMHGQVRQWARGPYLAGLLDLLFKNGFRVWLTSDHGNVEATGCGSPASGAVSDLRGKRVHIYRRAALRRRAAEEVPNARPWAPWGLPEDYLPLLAPGRSAFVRDGERVVAHGGASLEEVVVPLVRIDKADA